MQRSRRNRSKVVLGCLATLLVFPALLRGQAVVREALASFPADTRQLAYTNLAQLRTLASYAQIRHRLFTPRLSNFEDFLRSMGSDPEKEVDEVVLGWRSSPPSSANLFGLAQGRFDLAALHEFISQTEVPNRNYAGMDLYAFGTGDDPNDLFFAFLNPSLAAFGRLTDLKALLDVRSGSHLPLESKPELTGWEAELEGTAPLWGIVPGSDVGNLMAAWMPAGNGARAGAKTNFGSVQAVLYRLELDSGFRSQLSVLCQSAESATALAKLLTFWRDSQKPSTGTPVDGAASAGVFASLSELDIQSNGTRVELSTSGPLEALDPFLRIP